MLQSDNHNKRYDACEELRVTPQPLQQEAIDTLKIATNDVNPDVADAARRALAIHAPQLAPEKVVEVIEQEHDKTIKKPVKYWFLIGILMGAIPSLVSYIFFIVLEESPSLFASLATICMVPVGIVCGMIGAYIGNRNTKTAWVTAVLAAILGAGLFLAFAISTCLFCQ